MDNKLTIMQYRATEMREILDNLSVWDREKKVTHENCIKYIEEKREWGTGRCSLFHITALKEPLLVFYKIGELVEEKINQPEKVNNPNPYFG